MVKIAFPSTNYLLITPFLKTCSMSAPKKALWTCKFCFWWNVFLFFFFLNIVTAANQSAGWYQRDTILRMYQAYSIVNLSLLCTELKWTEKCLLYFPLFCLSWMRKRNYWICSCKPRIKDCIQELKKNTVT